MKAKIKAIQIKNTKKSLCQQTATIRYAKKSSSTMTLNGKSDLQEGMKRTGNVNHVCKYKRVNLFSSLKLKKWTI